MAAVAGKTLDLQYYIWEADTTGRILAERLLQAADRGVRVRLLLDDINLKGRDNIVAAMDAHENIEVRRAPVLAYGAPRLVYAGVTLAWPD